MKKSGKLADLERSERFDVMEHLIIVIQAMRLYTCKHCLLSYMKTIIYIYIYTHTYTYTHTYRYTYTYTHTYTYTYTYIHKHIHTYIHTLYLSISLSIYIYIYIYIYIFAYGERKRGSLVVAPIAQLVRVGSPTQEVRGSNPRRGGLGVSRLQASGGITTPQYIYRYIHTYVYVCMYVYIYIYMIDIA